MADCFELAHGISLLRFQHCFREANRLAHRLARHAYNSQLSISWDDEPPISFYRMYLMMEHYQTWNKVPNRLSLQNLKNEGILLCFDPNIATDKDSNKKQANQASSSSSTARS